jgi:hypothetical protein
MGKFEYGIAPLCITDECMKKKSIPNIPKIKFKPSWPHRWKKSTKYIVSEAQVVNLGTVCCRHPVVKLALGVCNNYLPSCDHHIHKGFAWCHCNEYVFRHLKILERPMIICVNNGCFMDVVVVVEMDIAIWKIMDI